jgi:hypothetical protein
MKEVIPRCQNLRKVVTPASISILPKEWPYCFYLQMSGKISEVRNVFLISLLERCLKAPAEVVIDRVVTLEIELSNPKHPIKFIDRQDCVMR